MVRDGAAHMVRRKQSYRDLLAEEKLLLVANHPKGSQMLLPSIVPDYLQDRG
jgi:hypothetical protein